MQFNFHYTKHNEQLCSACAHGLRMDTFGFAPGEVASLLGCFY